jgi:hypothetical protein
MIYTFYKASQVALTQSANLLSVLAGDISSGHFSMKGDYLGYASHITLIIRRQGT